MRKLTMSMALLLALPLLASAQVMLCTPSGWQDQTCKSFENEAQADAWSAENQRAIVREAAPLGQSIDAMVFAILKGTSRSRDSRKPSFPEVRCLSILGEDPHQNLLDELAEKGLDYMPCSQMKALGDAVRAERIFVTFYRFKPVDNNKVRVGWGASCLYQGFCGGSWVLDLQRDAKGQWNVADHVSSTVY
jgi:hypothetical protein